MDKYERVLFLNKIVKKIDNLKEQFPTTDQHTLNLVNLMLLEMMQEDMKNG